MIKVFRKFNIIYYSLILFILDLVLHFVFKESNYNLLHVLFFDIAIGAFLSFLIYVPKGIIKKILFIVSNIIVLLYSFLAMIEIFIKINYDSSYPIKTIASNISNVLSQYSDEVLDIAKNHLLLLFVFILLLILFFLLSKILFINDTDKISTQTIIIYISTIVLSTIFAVYTVNNNITNWSDNLVYNGLKTAIIYDLKINDNETFDFIDIYLEDNLTKLDETENDQELLNISDSKIENNEYDVLKSLELDDYNIMDYDFEELNKTEQRPEFMRTNYYLDSLQATKKNKYTGLFKNKNLIMICAEAWNSIIVNKELFPTMYRLIHNGFRLNNFYQPHSSSSTSSGEYSFMTGMIPVEDDYSFRDCIENNMGFSISSKLHNEG